MKNPKIKLTHVVITEDGGGYLVLECLGRHRTLSFDNGVYEKKENPCGVLHILDKPSILELGLLGTENSFFPIKENPKFYPEDWGLLDIFGMGIKTRH